MNDSDDYLPEWRSLYLSITNEQESKRILENYNTLLDEEEKRTLNEKNVDPLETENTLILHYIRSGILNEMKTSCSACGMYLIIASIFLWNDKVTLSKNIGLSMFFVVCILLILIYRRRDPTNKNRIQRTCRYLGMTMLLWAVLASWLHGYSIFIISLPCFLLLCLLAVFFEQIATDWQSFFIVFLGGNLVLFFFLYVMRLSIPPLHFVLAYLVKKEFDACRRRLDKFEINFFILEHTVFFRVQYLFIACLLLDTMGWESMPIEKITIDPLFPMYAMSFVLFMAELMIRLLSQKYDVLKESIKGDVSVGY